MRESKLLQLRNQSVFAPYFTDFVAQKRALGNKYDACVEALNLFDDFCMKHDVEKPVITEELYLNWCRQRPNENATTQNIRIRYVQLFCKYLHNNGMDAPYVFHSLPKRDRKFIPYIFTEEEITRLISAIDKHNSVPAVGTPIRHLVHPVLFRVLCGCGLRINEVLTLKTEDVDLSQGIFLIREAKGGKDRMIVLSDSLKEICCAYRAEPVIQEYGHEYFFPNRDHGYYDSSTIYADFRKYLLLSGIPHRGRGHGPRLHDLRHTFAVRVLSNWQREGKDLYTCLPILQTYLGHSQLSATEKYLRLVPELYSQVTEVFKAEFGSIFPEVQYEER